MMDFRIPVGDWIETAIDWLDGNVAWLFEALDWLFITLYDAINWAFSTPPALAVIIIFAALAIFARGWKFALGVVLGLLFIVGVGQWENSMSTIALVLVAVFLAVGIAIPLGIWAAKSDTVSAVVKPTMDFLQTLPAFVYLIPALAFFGIGVAPGIFATVIFALAPGVRLTELGIRGVNAEVVEAGQAFGAAPSRILRQIQLPLAMPSIRAGINQIIMLALSMVVIAGLVGAGGLGGEISKAIGTLSVSLGFEAGLSVVVLAIILDRFTSSFGEDNGLYFALRKRRSEASALTAKSAATGDTQEAVTNGPRHSPNGG